MFRVNDLKCLACWLRQNVPMKRRRIPREPHGVMLQEAVTCLLSLCYEIYSLLLQWVNWICSEEFLSFTLLWLIFMKVLKFAQNGRYTWKVRQIGVQTLWYHKHVIFFFIYNIGSRLRMLCLSIEVSRLRWCHVGKFLILNLWVVFTAMMCK
jgi:hypothetical protein